MNNLKYQTIIAVLLALCGGLIVFIVSADYTMTEAQAQKYCTPAEVYMVGDVQEDDLFIPASSIGRVDLKR